MTPERALLGRMVERLDKAAQRYTVDQWDLGAKSRAQQELAWLTAEMAKLPGNDPETPEGST